jgi:long-chain acyl-CoA synthetase
MVIGDKRRFCSALIVPAREALEDWAKGIKITYADYSALLKNEKTYELIEKEIERLTENFSQFEHIRKFILIPEPFSQEAGELTPTLKIKRNNIEKKFAQEIDRMYDLALE